MADREHPRRRLENVVLTKVVLVPLGTVVHLYEGTLPKTPILTRAAKRAGATAKNWIKISENNADNVGEDDLENEDDPSSEEEVEDEKEDSDEEEANSDEEEDSDEEEGEAVPEDHSSDDTRRYFSRKVQKSNIAELLYPNDTFLVAVDGAGGRGNSAMPREYAMPGGREYAATGKEPGQPGTEAVILLELKSIADIGLVGPPNVGKSTLLGAMSKARPQVGNYAFTTLRPNIGRVEYKDFYALSVADIPGLITGAHEDKGLGFDFLRHVERTKVFAYVLDCSMGVGDNKGSLAWKQLEELMFEMECYRPGMTNRPSLVIANKTDEDGAMEIVEEFKKRIELPVYPTCAVLGEGIPELKEGLRVALESASVDAPDLQDLKQSSKR